MKKLLSSLCLFFLLAFSSLAAFEGTASYREGSGVGYKNRYGKIQFYHAFENQSLQPFFDIRYLIMDKWRQGGNIGAGLGYQFAESNRFSVYTYFDLTQSRTKHLFNQITQGFSYTHPLVVSGKGHGELACYLNGYFPLKSLEKRISPTTFSHFKGQEAFLKKTDRFALTGMNLEIGYLSERWNDCNLYVAGSGYYFKRSNLHGFGGLGKVRIGYRDIISAELVVSGDRLFGTNVSGTLAIHIPLGKKERCNAKNKKYRRYRSRPVERFEPIALKKSTRTVVAKDSSGAALNFIFVNNLNGSDGSYEDPFATLSDAQNSSKSGDYIYLFPGDGTKKGYSDGFVMKERQTLAGSGAPLTLPTTEGPIVVPAQTSSTPIMTNTDGDGITIQKDCSVSGIVVDGATGHGFDFVPKETVSNLAFFNCSATNNTGKGFHLGVNNESDNAEKTVSATIIECTANDNKNEGFFLQTTDSNKLFATLDGCVAKNNQNSEFFIFQNSTTGQLRANLTDCYGETNSDHLVFNFLNTNGDLVATLTNCSGKSDKTKPIFTFGNQGIGSSLTATLTNCSGRSSGSNNIFNFFNGTTGTTTANLNRCSVTGSKNSLGSSFKFLNVSPGQIITHLTDCSSNANSNSSFDFSDLSSGKITATLTNCSSGENFKPFVFSNASSGSITTSLTDCSAKKGGDTGFEFSNTGAGSLTTILTNCTSENNTGPGFVIEKTAGSLDGEIKNCIGNNNDSTGFDIKSDNLTEIIPDSPDPISRNL